MNIVYRYPQLDGQFNEQLDGQVNRRLNGQLDGALMMNTFYTNFRQLYE